MYKVNSPLAAQQAQFELIQHLRKKIFTPEVAQLPLPSHPNNQLDVVAAQKLEELNKTPLYDSLKDDYYLAQYGNSDVIKTLVVKYKLLEQPPGPLGDNIYTNLDLKALEYYGGALGTVKYPYLAKWNTGVAKDFEKAKAELDQATKDAKAGNPVTLNELAYEIYKTSYSQRYGKYWKT